MPINEDGPAAWDEVQFDRVSLPPDVSELPSEEALEQMLEWFHHNFEDPAEHTPYESAEGGYQYIWGGPYEARDIFQSIWEGHVDDEVIEEAVDKVQANSFYWVPNMRRMQPPDLPSDFEEQEEDGLTTRELYENVQNRVAELEEALAMLRRDRNIGIGHNRPPEPIGSPLSEKEQTELSNAIEVIKIQPVEPADIGKAGGEAADVVKTKAEKIREWLGRQAGAFTDEAVKEAGKSFGKWAPAAFWLWVIDRMLSLSTAVTHWIKSIIPPL